MADELKPVGWIASSLKDLRSFPDQVQREVGFAIYEAQLGKKSINAKPLKGLGGTGVLEVLEDHDGDTYRAVYRSVRRSGLCASLLPKEVEVWDSDEQTRPGSDQIKAEGRAGEARTMERKEQMIEEGAEGTVFYGSGNVFADLGLPDAEEHLAKAKIAITIHDVMKARGLTQTQAAELMGIDQPKVSKIVRGRLREFSTEWLLARLLHMGMDVDIIIHTKVEPEKRTGAISVACVA